MVFCVGALWLAVAGAGWAQNCDRCHAKRSPGTAHDAVDCGTCHAGREKYPHPAGARPLACAGCHSTEASQTAIGVHDRARQKGNEAAPDCATCHGGAHEVSLPGTTLFRSHLIDTCGMCHSKEAEQLKASVHGRAVQQRVREAPVCIDCHGEHAILRPSNPSSPTHPNHIRDACARCHGDVQLTSKFGLPADRVVSYEASFHGLAAKAGSQTVANCGSCHGIHQILPSSDLKSMTNAANLPATCGACHPGAGKRFVLGPVHVVGARAEARALTVIRQVYIFLIAFTIGLMLLHNAGDWVRKVQLRFRGILPHRAAAPGEFRMFGLERVQHGLLLVSFTVLVWTGFALKYPEAFWARPLVAWESSWPVRGTVHRIAAGVMMAAAALHLISLFASGRLRRHWKSLWPRRSDLPEALVTFGYNLGLRSQKPPLTSHSYIEKAEYWAVVWGAVIMSISGIILWANTFFLARLPKIYMDLATAIHFYEAVLATLAIVVWHFYFVIFDPDVYPMDTAWLLGYSPRKRAEHSEPSEAATEQQASSLHPHAPEQTLAHGGWKLK